MRTRLFRSLVLYALSLSAFFCVPAVTAFAQALSVTLTPPLFQLTIAAGETWQSTLKVVNNNAYDVTYYTQVVDMQANGEDGSGKFIPIVAGSDASTLAHWITVPHDPIAIKSGQSYEVPFSVAIPKDAEPGGHYAAILVGTQPGGIHATGTMVSVSSYVSSLIFVRIKGDATESGRIREFLTSQTLYQDPKVDFTLRFENTGNVHLHPQGDITIYNMWGKERGKLLINQDTDFGNVLPQSVRRFTFSWEGDANPMDIGLYSAVVTLSYGDEGKHNTTATTYFWIVPLVPISIGLGILLSGILLLIWFIRRYIRRALMLETMRYGAPFAAETPIAEVKPHTPVKPSFAVLMEPVREGVIDLRRASGSTISDSRSMPLEETPNSWWQLMRKYKLFLAFIVLVVGGISAIWLYFSTVSSGSRHFQISDVHIEAEPSK